MEPVVEEILGFIKSETGEKDPAVTDPDPENKNELKLIDNYEKQGIISFPVACLQIMSTVSSIDPNEDKITWLVRDMET